MIDFDSDSQKDLYKIICADVTEQCTLVFNNLLLSTKKYIKMYQVTKGILNKMSWKKTFELHVWIQNQIIHGTLFMQNYDFSFVGSIEKINICSLILLWTLLRFMVKGITLKMNLNTIISKAVTNVVACIQSSAKHHVSNAKLVLQ